MTRQIDAPTRLLLAVVLIGQIALWWMTGRTGYLLTVPLVAGALAYFQLRGSR